MLCLTYLDQRDQKWKKKSFLKGTHRYRHYARTYLFCTHSPPPIYTILQNRTFAYLTLLFTHVHTCVHCTCVHVWRWKDNKQIFLRALLTLVFEAWSLSGLEFAQWAGLAGQKPRDPFCFLALVLELQSHIVPPRKGFIIQILGFQFRPSGFLNKHFTRILLTEPSFQFRPSLMFKYAFFLDKWATIHKCCPLIIHFSTNGKAFYLSVRRVF